MKVSNKAYKKLILHSCKHPSKSVDGLLLGKLVDGGKSIEVVDAVPLFHKKTLAPTLEFVTAVVAEYATKMNLVIVGYYIANELSSNRELPGLARSIGDTIQAKCPSAVLFLVDADFIGNTERHAIRVFRRSASNRNDEWKEVKSDTAASPILDNNVLTDVSELLSSETDGNGEPLWFTKLSDWDDHLENLSLDWRCPELSDDGEVIDF